ncbi:MAG: universal stress protein [Bacteroidota bacterium]
MYDLRRILVPTDFSPHAEAALRHAIGMAAEYEAEVTLLHVDDFSVSPLGARPERPEFVVTYQEKKREFFEQEFTRLRHLAGLNTIRLHTQVLQGCPYKVIVEEGERRDYDLVVIATRGLTHLSSDLIGSTAERVVRLSRQPVLSVMGPPVAGGKVTSILCPTDLSPAGNVALSYALSIARRYDALIYIQYISELEKPEREEDIRRRLPDLSEHHPLAATLRVEYVFDRDIEPSNSIIRFADDRNVGLIVMSTHGRKGLRRVYIGNNTAEVVRKSVRPVLTVTHPFHRQIFAAPVTQKKPLGIPAPDRH